MGDRAVCVCSCCFLIQRKEYIGEYCGHGQSKTAFILNGAPGDPYDGKILKVTANPDNEPHVFTEMTVRSPGTALRILYNSFGVVNLQALTVVVDHDHKKLYKNCHQLMNKCYSRYQFVSIASK